MTNKQRSPSLSYRLGAAIDNVISIFSPETACKRSLARNAYVGYEASTISRKDWFIPADSRAEALDKNARRTLRARARDLERNSDFIAGILKSFENNVIGVGLNMQAYTDNMNFNKRIELLFKQWAGSRMCDLTEQQNLNEMLTMMVRRYIVDGGILVQYSLNKDKSIPLQMQLREVDDFTAENNPLLASGNIISDGVELTRYGVPVAYWLTSADANGMELMAPERIPRELIDFVWHKKRPSQYREITELATSIVRIRDLDDYMSAVAFAQKTAACTSAFVETENYAAGVGRANPNPNDGPPIETIQGGSVQYLRPGEKLKTLIPAGQAAEVQSYTVTQQRLAASSVGLSLESATRNVERVNYSSARQNLLFDQKTFDVLRNVFLVHFLKPMYRRFVDACYFAGLLEGTGFEYGNENYYEVEFLAGGLPWIDPLKEANADSVKLANGGLSFQQYCAAQGVDWRDRLQDMAEVKEYAEELGVTLAYAPVPETNLEESEVDNEDGEAKGNQD